MNHGQLVEAITNHILPEDISNNLPDYLLPYIRFKSRDFGYCWVSNEAIVKDLGFNSLPTLYRSLKLLEESNQITRVTVSIGSQQVRRIYPYVISEGVKNESANEMVKNGNAYPNSQQFNITKISFNSFMFFDQFTVCRDQFLSRVYPSADSIGMEWNYIMQQTFYEFLLSMFIRRTSGQRITADSWEKSFTAYLSTSYTNQLSIFIRNINEQ